MALSSAAPCRPPGGTVFLFDKKKTRHFRLDGHNWPRRVVPPGAKQPIAESHEHLVVGRKKELHCYYTTSRSNLKRRVYWLLKKPQHGKPFYALVHYLSGSAAAATETGKAPDDGSDSDIEVSLSGDESESEEELAIAALQEMREMPRS